MNEDDTSLDWQDDGACVGAPPALWFSEIDVDVARAKATCSVCPVRGACLAWALATSEKHGIWGGATERERRAMQRPGTIHRHGTRTSGPAGAVGRR